MNKLEGYYASGLGYMMRGDLKKYWKAPLLPIFYLKGYAPITSALFVEQRILTELLNSSGVVSAQLLDENGLATLNVSSEQVQDFSSIIAVMEHSQESQSVTITTQNAILIANRLNHNRLLVIQLQASCNLGSIRKLLSKAVAELNALSAWYSIE